VSAEGGTPVEATRLDVQRQTGHSSPSFLPDGRHFLFFVQGTPESRGVYLGSIDSTDAQRLFDADSAAVFWPPDRVLFARQGALMARRLDPGTLQLTGDLLTVAGQVVSITGERHCSVSASSVGPIAYRPTVGERQLTWLDRSGRQAGTLGDADSSQVSALRLSPDGRTVALHRTVSGNTDVWLLDAARGVWRRFTTDPATEYNPTWSPDGSRIVFSSTRRQGVLDLYEKPVDGIASETALLASSENKNPRDWSPDGRFILHTVQSLKTGLDLWLLPLSGDRKPVTIAQTAFSEGNGRFSPDGRWIAYFSNETGRNEIYLQPFPGPGRKVQVSTAGGTSQEWRRDGRELFYLANDRLMAAPLTFNGSKVDVGTPVALFPVPAGTPYTAAPDGQRFLVAQQTKEASPITILLNWKPEATK
jgi:Tol biopolymer transport system component